MFCRSRYGLPFIYSLNYLILFHFNYLWCLLREFSGLCLFINLIQLFGIHLNETVLIMRYWLGLVGRHHAQDNKKDDMEDNGSAEMPRIFLILLGRLFDLRALYRCRLPY